MQLSSFPCCLYSIINSNDCSMSLDITILVLFANGTREFGCIGLGIKSPACMMIRIRPSARI